MSEVNCRIGHLDHLETPWGNAGGVVKKPEDVAKMARTGGGWIEHGSVTLSERYGNDRDPESGEFKISEKSGQVVRVYHYNPETGETHNSLGMPNPGADKVLADVPEMLNIADGYGKKIVFNLAPVSDDPVSESQELVRRFYDAEVDGIILNAGCPNVVTEKGDRHEILSRNPEVFGRVLRGLGEIGVGSKYPPIWVVVSPQESYRQARDIYSQIKASGVVSAVRVPNSWPNRRPVDADGDPIIEVPGGFAGLTGPATADEVHHQVSMALHFLRSTKIDTIASGAVMDCEAIGLKAYEQLQNYLDLGAAAVAGTTFYYENPDWNESTHRLLSKFLD
jgi:dihydroorotate dehydrogenase